MKKKIILIVFTALLAISSVILLPTITGVQPDRNTLPSRTIEIGVVTPTWEGLPFYMDSYDKIVKPEINEYLAQLPGMAPPLQVEFLLRGPDGPDEPGGIPWIDPGEWFFTPERHLEIVKELAGDGVEFFIAGIYSDQFEGAIDYINENDLIMVSSGSTNPDLAWDDNGFRLAPPDTLQAVVLNEMLLTYDEGIDALVAIQIDNIWGNGYVDALDDEYDGVIERIPYPDTTTEFTDFLILAENAADDLVAEHGGEDHVGVLVVAYGEGVDILQQANHQDYDQLYDLSWFGTEAMGRDATILVYAGVEAGHVHLVSALGAIPESVKFNDLTFRYQLLGYGEASFLSATAVDAAWLIVNAYLDMKASTNSPITGADMAAIFSDTAYGYYGYSGWTMLDEYGDRTTIDYDIWGFGPDPVTGVPSIINYGRYDSISGELTWDYEPQPWD